MHASGFWTVIIQILSQAHFKQCLEPKLLFRVAVLVQPHVLLSCQLVSAGIVLL